jgi:thioredoxin 1
VKSNLFRISAVMIVVLAIGFAMNAGDAVNNTSARKPAKPAAKQLPKLLDLGATKCIPCKMMAPILGELAKEYKGQLDVQFIDVWKDQKAAKKHKIQTIPTQIFYDAKGKEFFRHVGFFPKVDILKAFEKQGIKLKKSAEPKKPEGRK